MKKLAFLIALILVAIIGTASYRSKNPSINGTAGPQTELQALAERNRK